MQRLFRAKARRRAISLTSIDWRRWWSIRWLRGREDAAPWRSRSSRRTRSSASRRRPRRAEIAFEDPRARVQHTVDVDLLVDRRAVTAVALPLGAEQLLHGCHDW